jgi:hypothetical protein
VVVAWERGEHVETRWHSRAGWSQSLTSSVIKKLKSLDFEKKKTAVARRFLKKEITDTPSSLNLAGREEGRGSGSVAHVLQYPPLPHANSFVLGTLLHLNATEVAAVLQ